MKTWHKSISFLIFAFSDFGYFLTYSQTSEPTAPPPKVEFVDYNTLDHSIIITKIRAGNHDPEGINQYYFKVKLIGLINKTEEKKLDTKEQKNISEDIGEFCKLTLPALSYWEPDPKKETVKYTFEVKGTIIRALTAKMMNQFNIKEQEVAVRVDINMWETQKQYYFLTNDKIVASISYFPLPYTPSDQKPRMNQKIQINDDLGTDVSVSVSYVQPYVQPTTTE